MRIPPNHLLIPVRFGPKKQRIKTQEYDGRRSTYFQFYASDKHVQERRTDEANPKWRRRQQRPSTAARLSYPMEPPSPPTPLSTLEEFSGVRCLYGSIPRPRLLPAFAAAASHAGRPRSHNPPFLAPNQERVSFLSRLYVYHFSWRVIERPRFRVRCDLAWNLGFWVYLRWTTLGIFRGNSDADSGVCELRIICFPSHCVDRGIR